MSVAAEPQADAGVSDDEAQRALESIRRAHLEVRAYLREAGTAQEPEWQGCVAERLAPLAELRHHAEAVRAGPRRLGRAHWQQAVATARRLRDEASGCELFVGERRLVWSEAPLPPGDFTEWKLPPVVASFQFGSTARSSGPVPR